MGGSLVEDIEAAESGREDTNRIPRIREGWNAEDSQTWAPDWRWRERNPLNLMGLIGSLDA